MYSYIKSISSSERFKRAIWAMIMAVCVAGFLMVRKGFPTGVVL